MASIRPALFALALACWLPIAAGSDRLAGTVQPSHTTTDAAGDTATTSATAGVQDADGFSNVPLQSRITGVQPMTGIVLWANHLNNSPFKKSGRYIQLEYSYVRPSDVIIGEAQYDWSSLEQLVEGIRSRGNQAILRWHYVYPGAETAVPDYIKALPNYRETTGTTEGQLTHFPDWSNGHLQSAHLDFYTAFAARYDNDPRIAFLQTGFGLWGEYHIYQPGVVAGVNFPSNAYQAKFLSHLDKIFSTLKWSVSIDAGSADTTPIAASDELLALSFGLFDDSFMHSTHHRYNAEMWDVLNHRQRFHTAPHGGELSYYSNTDQRHALDATGLHGRTYEQLSAEYNITYMIGNDQPRYHSFDRIKQAGMANGYRFEITSFRASATSSQIRVANTGIAPIYYDAFVAINGVRATASLKGLPPGESLLVEIPSGAVDAVVTIECDRLVDGQSIEFAADLI